MQQLAPQDQTTSSELAVIVFYDLLISEPYVAWRFYDFLRQGGGGGSEGLCNFKSINKGFDNKT